MNLFGLLSLLIAIALGIWWLTTSGPLAPSALDTNQTSYQESIEAAQHAAELLER